MTVLGHIDEAIGALTTRVQWYRSRGRLKRGKAFRANRRRAELALAFWLQVRDLHAAKDAAR